ncbi:hypothetical protein HYH03_015868 [Edaphochlamys debaryana]|uniref:Acetyl-CoA carboxylase n=1 Tax=Edaphochlamys debaryana TaxID=47281 RepID=A0A836BS09_9CHLO|nr:hypothetical protein HYH03_015868 [Edaphochlamys debaryana]|eukprot:KAG2485379.1 hypothetical protein HYH03_015868 [Edaphochlamys debaryana]
MSGAEARAPDGGAPTTPLLPNGVPTANGTHRRLGSQGADSIHLLPHSGSGSTLGGAGTLPGGGAPRGRGAPRRVASLSRQLEDYCHEMGGDRPIYSVLVANNGLAAVKFMRSVRSWASQALGAARAVALVALATPDDMRVNAEHIALADQFVEVPGGTNNNNYANVELIVNLALRAGVDAVWPGWGHASENPELPTALAAHGIRFLGPPAGPMAALGDKIGSTLLAQAAGVPTLPWSGSHVAVAVEAVAAAGGAIDPATYAAACIGTEDVEAAVKACRDVGYPVMLKASWGGGGKGIRKVSSDDEVRSVFRQVAGEVPGSPIFAMKLARTSRHLEVQLLCDMHGNVASLYSRDCSVQRRHQKIVEEGPVRGVPEDILCDMERCARALARLVGYVGAATVEYLYGVDEQQYYFLELNPRLQVEHPVTEGITGVNLPACQLLVGMGVPLYRIPYLRSLYGKDPKGIEPIDFETTEKRPPEGHVVAVRVTAEDAGDGFKPTAGRIDELHFRPTPDVWGYFSVKSGGGIHQFSDSQFGHLFARGDTREAALRAMAGALRDCLVVRGEIRTTTDYVLDLLASPELSSGAVHTGWLDSRIAARVKPGRPPWHISVIAGAVVKSSAAVAAASSEYLGYLSKGQLPPPGVSLIRMEHTMVIEGLKYTVALVRRGVGAACVSLNGSSVDVAYRKMGDGGFLMQVDGESHVIHYEDEAAGTRLLINGLTVLLAAEADPSRLTASSPGKLVRRLVPAGAHVALDQPYAEMEVMKMVMPLLSPAAGVISWSVPEGAVLGAGELIASLDLDDGAAVAAPEPFPGALPELGPPQITSSRVDAVLAGAVEAARNILAGYVEQPEQVLEDLVACLDSPALALMQWAAEFAVVRGRMPSVLAATLESTVAGHAADVAAAEAAEAAAEAAAAADGGTGAGAGAGGGAAAPVEDGTPTAAARGASDGGAGGALAAAVRCGDFPSAAVIEVMETAQQEAAAADAAALGAALEPLLRLARAHAGGRQAYARGVVVELLEAFLGVEEAFCQARRDAVGTGGPGADAGGPGGATDQEAVDWLRKRHAGKLQAVLELVVSHQGLALKCQLVAGLMARLVLPAPASYRPLLRRLAALAGPGTGALAARSAQLLEQSLLADLRAVVARALSGLEMFTASGPGASGPASGPEQGGGAGGVTSPTAAGAAGAVGGVSPKSGSGTPGAAGPGGGSVVRRSTVAEGLFSGLPVSARGSLHVSSGLEAQVERLVAASAAVEDALAGLAVDAAGAPPHLRRRAALTYVRRLYAPFLLREPLVASAGAGAEGALLAVWMYDDPAAANTPHPTQRLGAMLLLDSLAGLTPGLKALGATLEPLRADAGASAVGTLHVALAPAAAGGASGGGSGGRHSRQPSVGALPPLAAGGAEAAALDALLPPSEQGVDASRATAAAVAAAVAAAAAAIRRLGFAAVSAIAPSSSAGPLRLGWRWVPSAAVADAAAAAAATEDGSYQPDSFMSAVEPITGSLLELSSLSGAASGAASGPAGQPGPAAGPAGQGGLMYRPSRNRQWHLYTAVERRDARSAPLRRLFVRGLVRSLGHPALLAASYSGNGGAVAAAAMQELEETLTNCLDELQRSTAPAAPGAGSSGAATAATDAAAARPDWTHLFVSVLPPLPLPPGGRDDGRVAAALRSAAAALAARHGGALRAAAVSVWETRLRGPLREAGWRVVVSMPTGHEHGEEHVEVYREAPYGEYSSYLGTHPQAANGHASASAAAPGQPPPRVYVPALQYTAIHPPAAPPPPAHGHGNAATNYLHQLIHGGGGGYGHQPSQISNLTAQLAAHSIGGRGSGGGAGSAGGAAGGGGAGGAVGAAAAGSLAGVLVGSPYPPLEPLQQKRLAARRHNVTYVYDFPAVFEAALRDLWAARAAAGEPNSMPPAGRLVETVELVLPPQPAPGPGGGLQPCSDFRSPPRLQPAPPGRPPVGGNDCGMVCWLMTLRTPECPQGRSVIAVANDITWGSGSFSPAEDAVFRAACDASLEERLPLLYLAANAGARVGLATEVRDCLRVQWLDPEQPEQGWAYLYLEQGDYHRLTGDTPPGQQPSVRAEPRATPSGTHYVITDVVGAEDGLGVECLSGSASIASAFCRAWREGYTVTLVSGRTVGIGAYLARLGRRCVQRADQPIVLTGYAALNKLLGRQVYTSHMQLGGPRVMGVNGVSHHVVQDDLEGDDLEGVRTMLQLLSYAPPQLGGPPPALPSADPVERGVAYAPGPGEKLDPRAAIAGRDLRRSATPTPTPASAPHPPSAPSWQSGLFDRGSWLESQAGWARTVVAGRARLGGVPVGVLAVESSTVMRQQPADPGMPDSCESVIPQAGQVWFPDSAEKTAAAMEEFDAEGLPLFILANWRGFSGGMRDLFDGVLQAGSLIVERLRTYRQPVFVYIPAGAELRGGAWVVVDSQINAGAVEVYADPSARGGVLEPEGVCEIKFRTPDLVRMMHRVDPVLSAARARGAPPSDPAVRARERALLPTYSRIARAFADLHDTPVRMAAKGVLAAIVPWPAARAFFATRLRRRLLEQQLLRHAATTDPGLSRERAEGLLRSWREAAEAAAAGAAAAAAAAGRAGGDASAGADGDGGMGRGGPLSPMSPTSQLESTLAAAGGGGGGGGGFAPPPAGPLTLGTGAAAADPLEPFSAAAGAQRDRAFLVWAESAAGRAAIAGELRALRCRSAAELVAGVLGSVEGQEGLLRALQEAMGRDASLGLQLRMLLQAGAGGGGGGAAVGGAGAGAGAGQHA